eukprot:1253004-Lingulodinium_polyedra.AAC.1
MKAYLQQKAKALVAESEGRAVLFTYGSDSTPVKTRETYSATLEWEYHPQEGLPWDRIPGR